MMQDVILHGDCLELLKTLPDNSVDSLCCDPPAGISFMSKSWDSDKGGKQEWIAWLSEVMREALRCVKPGGHALVWALPRTSHWTATALEDAGWSIRDVITHLNGQGYPKSHDISKAIDRMAGAEREKVRTAYTAHSTAGKGFNNEIDSRPWMTKAQQVGYHEHDGPLPATPDAQRWQGFGSALKPASEHWLLARKPLAAANLASNVLAWGVGGLAIDRCRVAGDVPSVPQPKFNSPTGRVYNMQTGEGRNGEMSQASGRWPPNFLLSHSAACTPQACSEQCAVRLLDEQAGERKSGGGSRGKFGGMFGNGKPVTSPERDPSTGPASRFFPVFYAAKSSRRERNAGCEALPEAMALRFGEKGQGPLPQQTPHVARPEQNNHPCVKSLSLMAWLVRLITPPGGTVLDPFAGSGSTLVACIYEKMHFIGMEQSEDYCTIARARLAHALQEAQQTPVPRKPISLATRRRKARANPDIEQMSLFA
jgi:site-specific DNA-methyltransferase (adenine-specific)